MYNINNINNQCFLRKENMKKLKNLINEIELFFIN